jgi:hypothetical protein
VVLVFVQFFLPGATEANGLNAVNHQRTFGAARCWIPNVRRHSVGTPLLNIANPKAKGGQKHAHNGS